MITYLAREVLFISIFLLLSHPCSTEKETGFWEQRIFVRLFFYMPSLHLSSSCFCLQLLYCLVLCGVFLTHLSIYAYFFFYKYGEFEDLLQFGGHYLGFVSH